MIKIIIEDKIEILINKIKVIRTLLWFDPLSKKMLQFEGGKLDLVNMVFDKKRQTKVPRVIDVFDYPNVKKKNREVIKKWFQKYHNYNNTNIKMLYEADTGIELDIPNKEVEDVLYDLERNSFKFAVI